MIATYRLFLIPLFLSLNFSLFGQDCNDLDIQLQAEISSNCGEITMTMIHDQLDRPYLYIAHKEAGLSIYDISDLSSPQSVANVPISLLGDLHVMNLSQTGNYLYLATGNFLGLNPQLSGMAVVDVSDPTAPIVMDHWDIGAIGGSGIVQAVGNYAYLGAMTNGLAILDISNKSDIQLVSVFKPDINYPPVFNPNPNLYNARGMSIDGDILYLCYDAGGIRVINVADKSQPRETGRYVNLALSAHPRAYNNSVLEGSLLYVAVDYCGVEILNVADTSAITVKGRWNPYDCPNNNWFNTPVHANEIHLNPDCGRAYVSTGKSDMYVLDISDPNQPDSCGIYGGVNNDIGTWGIGLYQNQIYLSYICTLGIPFASNQTGVHILTHNLCSPDHTSSQPEAVPEIDVFPLPAHEHIQVEWPLYGVENVHLRVINAQGKVIQTSKRQIVGSSLQIDVSTLPAGAYWLQIEGANRIFSSRFIKN